MPSVEWNKRVWGEMHRWEQQGDEWSGMAAHCGQPYQRWKQALVEAFISPVPEAASIIEIAPGHGRWTALLLAKASNLALVDINESCLDACREQFGDSESVSYHLTDGSTMPFLADRSIDFAWSFDAFVHMDPPVVTGYLTELARVMAPGGQAVIHHAGQAHWSLALAPLTRALGRPGRAVQRLLGQRRLRDGGNRSLVSRRLVADHARRVGLRVEQQVDRWGPAGEFTVTKYRDCLTILRQPRSASR